MKRGRRIASVAVVMIVTSCTQAGLTRAVDADLSQRIDGIANCDIDEVYSGFDVQYTILPEKCSDHLPSSTGTLPESIDGQQHSFANITVDRGGLATASDSNGDQGSLENTIVEPLAAWLGVGNPKASPANPVIATATLGTGTGLAIDAALFESQYRRLFLSNIRRLLRILVSRISF